MAGNTYDVTTTATSGTGSLEQALTNATSGDTIQFKKGGTFNLDKSYALNGAITFDLDGNNDTVGGGALTGAGSLTLTDSAPNGGPHTLTLTAANTYTGATSIVVGTLALGTGGSVADSSVVDVADGATFDVSFGGFGQSTSVEALSGAGTVATTSPPTMMMSGKGSTALSLTGDGTTTFNGTITGSGSLIEDSAAGTGVQVLTGTSSYTGGTTLQAGTLSVSSDANLGNASGGLTFRGGTLEITGDGFASARNATLNGVGTVQVDTGALTLTGVLSNGMNAGALTKTGAGTLFLENKESYSGTTTIAAGTLGLRNNDAENTIGSLSGAIVDNATLRLSEYGNGPAVTVANAISGSGGIVAASGEDQSQYDGIVTLSGANTYTGATLVEYGTLRGGRQNAFGTNSAVTVAGLYGEAAALDLGGFDQAIGSLAGGSSGYGDYVTNSGPNDATLTVGGDNTDTAFDGSIGDGASKLALNKVGTGRLTLGADGEYSQNTYSGTTTIAAGTLELATNAAISANTTFDFSDPGAGTLQLDQAPPIAKGMGVAALSNAIKGFGQGDGLDLRALPFNSGATATLQGNVLRVVSGAFEGDFTLTDPGATTFTVTSDGDANGSLITTTSPASPTGSAPTPTGPTPGDDNLVGTDGNDAISLGAGNDTYSGGLGNDLIYGNQGNDLAYGNQGDDTIFGGMDQDTAYGGQGNDMIYGNRGDDVVYGNQGNDKLFGGMGNDTLYGGMGDDVLFGGKGDDVLVGGQGNNTFGFNPGDTDFQPNVGTGDTVADFVSGTDKIDFTAGPAATANNFGSGSVAGGSFAQLQAAAQQLISGGKVYAFETDGVNGYLFTSAGGPSGTIEDAVKLTGANTQASVKAADIVGGPVAMA